METLRSYIADQTELETYTGSLTSFSSRDLIRAEQDIDSIIGNYYEGVNRKFYANREVFESSKITLSSTTATIADNNNSSGFYSYCVLEILSGANKGLRKLVISSTLSGGNNVLTFNVEEVGLTGSEDILIYQIAKIPRIKDITSVSSSYYKSIPEFIKEAVALQYQFRLNNEATLTSSQTIKRERTARDSVEIEYSDSSSGSISTQSLISPQALSLLQDEGLTSITA